MLQQLATEQCGDSLVVVGCITDDCMGLRKSGSGLLHITTQQDLLLVCCKAWHSSPRLGPAAILCTVDGSLAQPVSDVCIAALLRSG